MHHGLFKVVWYPNMDEKVCLNLVKKDQLCAIALKRENEWMFAILTSNSLLKLCFIALTPTVPVLLQIKI